MPAASDARHPFTAFALAYVRERGMMVPAPCTLVFRRGEDRAMRALCLPDEADVNEELLRRLKLPGIRLERGHRYLSAANGEAAYVPVGESRLEDCVRYGRLYLRTNETQLMPHYKSSRVSNTPR